MRWMQWCGVWLEARMECSLDHSLTALELPWSCLGYKETEAAMDRHEAVLGLRACTYARTALRQASQYDTIKPTSSRQRSRCCHLLILLETALVVFWRDRITGSSHLWRSTGHYTPDE